MNPKDIVRLGCDRVSYASRADTFETDGSSCPTFLAWLEPRLNPDSRLLDLGCGSGIPVARRLARQHQVTGVDISPVQIEHARELVPAATP